MQFLHCIIPEHGQTSHLGFQRWSNRESGSYIVNRNNRNPNGKCNKLITVIWLNLIMLTGIETWRTKLEGRGKSDVISKFCWQKYVAAENTAYIGSLITGIPLCSDIQKTDFGQNGLYRVNNVRQNMTIKTENQSKYLLWPRWQGCSHENLST